MGDGSAINAPAVSSSSSAYFFSHRFLRHCSDDKVSHHLCCITEISNKALRVQTCINMYWYKENRWDPKLLVGSGGMPSSHSSTVTALATAIGFYEGFHSSLFATAAVLACVVMYDAFGVQLHAGKQAEVLNQIVYELPTEHPLAETRPSKELLGHTPSQ